LTVGRFDGDNEGMASPETTSPPKPFQFSLASIFLATAAVGVALGLLRWLGFSDFASVVYVAVQNSAVIAVWVKSRGTAWFGVLNGGLTARRNDGLHFCGGPGYQRWLGS